MEATSKAGGMGCMEGAREWVTWLTFVFQCYYVVVLGQRSNFNGNIENVKIKR